MFDVNKVDEAINRIAENLCTEEKMLADECYLHAQADVTNSLANLINARVNIDYAKERYKSFTPWE